MENEGRVKVVVTARGVLGKVPAAHVLVLMIKADLFTLYEEDQKLNP